MISGSSRNTCHPDTLCKPLGREDESRAEAKRSWQHDVRAPPFTLFSTQFSPYAAVAVWFGPRDYCQRALCAEVGDHAMCALAMCRAGCPCVDDVLETYGRPSDHDPWGEPSLAYA